MNDSITCPRCGAPVDTPIRRQIVRELAHVAEGKASPKLLAEAIPGTTIGRIAYHVGVLKRRGDVELVETRQRRGATEHFYQLTAAARQRENGFV